MVVRTGTSDQSHYLFKQGGKMISIQGLLIAFMFGVAVTMTISAMWLLYAEYRIAKEEIIESKQGKIIQRFYGEIFQIEMEMMMKDNPKVISICTQFNLNTFTQGDVKWLMFDSKEAAIKKQTTEELDEPTVLQHFDIVGKTSEGFVLELQEGIEIKAVEVKENPIDEHDRYEDMQEYRARMNEDGG
jgi:hypothetical protein